MSSDKWFISVSKWGDEETFSLLHSKNAGTAVSTEQLKHTKYCNGSTVTDRGRLEDLHMQTAGFSVSSKNYFEFSFC